MEKDKLTPKKAPYYQKDWNHRYAQSVGRPVAPKTQLKLWLLGVIIIVIIALIIELF